MAKELRAKMIKMKKLAAKEKPMEDTPVEEAAEKPEFEKHEIESAADTLMRAEELKANDKLMAHVHQHLSKKKTAIDSLAALRAKAAEVKEPEEVV